MNKAGLTRLNEILFPLIHCKRISIYARFFLCFTSIVCFSGCVTLNSMQQSSHDEYGKMNFHNLDGKYANCPDSVHGEGIKDVNSNEVRPTSFWNVIHGFYGDGCSAARESGRA